MGFELLAVCFYMQFNTVVFDLPSFSWFRTSTPKRPFVSNTCPSVPLQAFLPNELWLKGNREEKLFRIWISVDGMVFPLKLMQYLCHHSKMFQLSQPFSCWQYTPSAPGLKLPEISISTAMLIGNFENYSPNISEDLRLAYMNFYACLPII